MPVRARPTKPKGKEEPTVDVDELIRKGGSAAGDQSEGAKKPITPVLLRVPTNLLGKVDQVLTARLIKIPRHTWILEAIQEKLDREVS